MKKLLKKHFGFDKFKPFQEKIITNILQKNDTLVIMPTGGGKSLCFQLPALQFPGLTLVISPLISLMKDQVDSLKANGIAAEFINSSLSYQEINDIQGKAKTNKIKILYLAPERLASHYFQNWLQTLEISLIAIDEAHCISEWGHDFRPDYRNLKFFKQNFPHIPTIALTATATPKVQKDIVRQLDLHKPTMYIASFDRANLAFHIYNKTNAFDKLIHLLKKYKNKSAIIYCFSRKETEKIASDLQANGFKALPYHAGLDNQTRQKNQDLFINDQISIIVATIAFGMGIDKPDVRLVVHWVFPKSLEGYYQEVGRAGRDGLPSECITFYSSGDLRKHQFFIDQIEDINEQNRSQQKVNKVIEYCEQANCRRKYLLAYFGEEFKHKSCDACDICLSPKETFAATAITQKILATIIQTKQRFGKKYIIDILRGKNLRQIINRGHNKLQVHGLAHNFSDNELKHIINSLIASGLLQSSQGQYPTISLTTKGKNWLKQKDSIKLPKFKEDELDKQRKDIYKYSLDYNTSLFEKLKLLRKQIAIAKKVPPFVIFSDVSLQEMAYYFPQSKEDFLKIQGVGQQKLASFGHLFLRTIVAFCQQNKISSQAMPFRAQRISKTNMLTYEKTREMLLKKLSLQEMSSVQDLTINTIINHLDKLLDSEKNINIDYLKPDSDYMKIIKQALVACSDDRLKPVYEYLNEKYSYEQIRLVRLFLKQSILNK